jgi:hypothetical protein
MPVSRECVMCWVSQDWISYFKNKCYLVTLAPPLWSLSNLPFSMHCCAFPPCEAILHVVMQHGALEMGLLQLQPSRLQNYRPNKLNFFMHFPAQAFSYSNRNGLRQKPNLPRSGTSALCTFLTSFLYPLSPVSDLPLV